jgi:holo-[acyl-carrier protein] synthase
MLIGFDLMEIERVSAWVEDPAKLSFFLTPAERTALASAARPAESLAAWIAAKEATMKAIGTGWSGEVRWVDVEVQHDAAGRPTLQVSGAVASRFKALGVTGASLSISHTRHTAGAVVLLVTNPAPPPG